MSMKKVLLVLALMVSVSVTGQKGDYLIKSNGDTVYCEIKEGNGKVTAMIDGNRVKFSAKDLRRYSHNGRVLVSGKIYIPAQYRSAVSFLEVVIDGPMMLCISNYAHTSENIQGRRETSSSPIYYAKLKSSESNKYTLIAMNWKKKLMSLDPDCDALSKEVQDAKFYQLSKLVKTYNETCGKE
jgi:hypothetical protein